MKRILNSFRNFFARVKFKRLKKYEQFGITFAITYLITVLFALLVVFNYFEDIMIATKNTSSIWSFITTTQNKFTFGYCNDLNAWTYLVAKMFETLIPTTLTFSGTILVLQTTKTRNTSLNAFLFISLFGFAMIGMFFMVAKLQTMLNFYMWVLLFLFFVVFIFSAKVFALQDKDDSVHKNEESDGQITG